MGEDERIAAGQRRIWLIAAVGVVVAVIFLTFLFRSCAVIAGRSQDKYTVIYKNLDLKDSANVAVRLKDLKIDYQLRDQGRSIAVLKNTADAARLGLAEKNLPAGGVVGWEIFDETKLGATDFDRRVQFIRAISGELARTIRVIDIIEDARVQIVIPKTELFAPAAAPVTASVLLQIRPGENLTREQVNGIVHLVASSVENLSPENVTIVDVSGYILASAGKYLGEENVEAAPPPEKIIATEPKTLEVLAAEVKTLTLEEKLGLFEQLKEKLESGLSAKAQNLLNEFYPPNSVIVRVNLDLDLNKFKKNSANPEDANFSELLKIKRLSAIVLVDNRFDLNPTIKKSTFDAVASAVGYEGKRGDVIKLHRVPFHYASVYNLPATPEALIAGEKIAPEKKISFWTLVFSVVKLNYLFALLVVLILFAVLGVFLRGVAARRPPAVQFQGEEMGNVMGRVRDIVSKNPQRAAELIKKWLGG